MRKALCTAAKIRFRKGGKAVNNIEIKRLTVSFDGITVLNEFSHTFPAGSKTCIMGPSGCGKTTLINAMLGLVKPESGIINGMPEKVSCVFQEDRLCEDFSALSNVRLTAAKRFSKTDIEELLKSLGITEFQKSVNTFSGGMKRRVALARAIAADSDLILLDEAFKGLDDESKLNAQNVLMRCSVGKTVISVTHDEDEADRLGGEIIRLF